MKKVLFVVAMLMGCCHLWAAEYEYVPLVREGVEWNYKAFLKGMSSEQTVEEYYRVRLIDGIEINGKSYYKAYRYKGCEFDEECAHLIAYIREEDKKVYVFPATFDKYDSTQFGQDYKIGTEEMIYDFNKKVGDFISTRIYYPLEIKEVTTEEIGGKLRNKYVPDRLHSIIEGIGFINDLGFDLIYPFQMQFSRRSYWGICLNYVRENGEVVYKSPNYDARDVCASGVAEVKSTDNIAIAIGGGNIEVRCADAPCQAIEIVDLGGRLIKKKICDNESTTTISAKGIEKGVYILVVNTTKGISSRKIIL